jgi:hypothetical protein
VSTRAWADGRAALHACRPRWHIESAAYRELKGGWCLEEQHWGRDVATRCGRLTRTCLSFNTTQVYRSRAGEQLATVAIRRLRRTHQPMLGVTPPRRARRSCAPGRPGRAGRAQRCHRRALLLQPQDLPRQLAHDEQERLPRPIGLGKGEVAAIVETAPPRQGAAARPVARVDRQHLAAQLVDQPRVVDEQVVAVDRAAAAAATHGSAQTTPGAPRGRGSAA